MPNFSLKKWEKIVENFYLKYKGLHAWQKTNYKEVCKQGQIINPTGRILKFDKKKGKDGWQYKWAEVCNYPVQSLATADIIPLWMCYVYKDICQYPDIKFIMQVHDEIVLDCPQEYVDMTAKACYTNCIRLPEYIEKFFGFNFNVLLSADVKVGDSWASVTKYKIGDYDVR